MPRLLAKRQLRLRDFTAEAGEVFELPERNAQTLVAVGFASRVDGQPTVAPAANDADIAPVAPVKVPRKRGPDKKPRTRRYKTRAMVAEE